MRRRTLLSASLGLGSLASLAYFDARSIEQTGLRPYSGVDQAFGTSVSIKVLHTDALVAQSAIASALQQIRFIDHLMSLYQEPSQVYQLNQRGQIDAPDPHLLRVLNYAQHLSWLTDGAFDVTVQPLWQEFTRARGHGTLPTPQALAKAKSLVNWQQLQVTEQQVWLSAPGMGITLNGLAQGYAVDLALAALRAKGIEHALLDAGEFGTIGGKSLGQAWVLGVKHPRQENELSARVALENRQLATSGDYETTFSSDFVHHHIFDPASGDSPLALASVTVLAPTGMMADGLSTAFMVMGAERSLALAAQLPQVDAMLIHKNGTLQKTDNFPVLPA